MSNASTVAYYIELACRGNGKDLDRECSHELRDALDGMVEEAVSKAVAALKSKHE